MISTLIFSLLLSPNLALPLVQDRVVGNMNGFPIRRAELPDVSRFAHESSTQRMSQWCWAASIANVFGYLGHPVTQETIVRTIYGRVVNLPSYGNARVIAALNTSWVDTNGRPFRARVTCAYNNEVHYCSITNDFMVNELRANRPILYGSTHCMVVTAIDYLPNGAVLAAGVFDPWPASPRLRLISGSDVAMREIGGNMRFLASVSLEDLVGQHYPN